MLTGIIGQESVIASIQAGLKMDELPQTYLFAGEHQIGKTTTALALAKAVLCIRRLPGGVDSCDVCSSCKAIDAGQHPDVRSVRPSGPSKVIRMAQFWPRDNVKEHPADKAMLRDLHFAPVSGKRRFFIVESAECMNEDTANSLLKALEEPPSYATFILAAVSTESVLPTIFSRSQSLRFRPVSQRAINAALMQRGVDSERAAFLAVYAQGRPGVAFRAASAPDLLKTRNEILEIAAESSRGWPLITSFRIADDFRKASVKLADNSAGDDESGSRGALTAACDVLLYWYRDLLVRRSTDYAAVALNPDWLTEIDRLAARYSVEELERAIRLVQESKRFIARNANAQLTTENLMFNLLALGASRDRPA